jgi:hypothetical protein
MPLSWKVLLALFLITILVFTTPYFGRVETKRFSAYAACRNAAMNNKSYAAWKEVRSTPRMFRLQVIFWDGYSEIDCRALGIGPFWIVRKFLVTWGVCEKDLGNGKKTMCQEDYYGVSP